MVYEGSLTGIPRVSWCNILVFVTKSFAVIVVSVVGVAMDIVVVPLVDAVRVMRFR